MAHLVPGQQIVLRLFDDWPDQIQPLSYSPSLCDLLSRPFAGAPIESPPLVDHIVHRSDGFFNGGRRVWTVTVNNVDILHIHSLQRSFCALHDVLSGQSLIIWTRSTPEDLSGDDDIGATPTQLADCLTHDLLGSAIGVDLGVIEEVDAVITAALQ